jgi:hypothetical protein
VAVWHRFVLRHRAVAPLSEPSLRTVTIGARVPCTRRSSAVMVQ